MWPAQVNQGGIDYGHDLPHPAGDGWSGAKIGNVSSEERFSTSAI